MAGTGLALSDVIIGAVVEPGLAAGTLGAVGLAGVTDWILGDDEPPEEGATDGGDPVFDEPQGAADGGAPEGEFAFDDGGDAFGEFDVDEDEEGDAGAGVADLERRVDGLEEEIDGISSTVSTVRTENEQISESVEGIEENVRKLLDIYKMVTKGVNPFVDQEGGDSVANGEEHSLGLFEEEDEGPDEPEEDLDEEVIDADPDEFFDDDFEEDDHDMDHQDAAPDDEPSEDDGPKSFDDLREEYEEDAELTEEGTTDSEDDEPGAAASTDEDTGAGAGSDADPDLSAMDSRLDRVDEPMDETVAAALAAGPDAGDASPRADPRTAHGAGRPGRQKPYLREVPGGYVADLVVMEWVEFLVTVGGPEGAHRAITYYENVEWLVPEAADQLREFVEGHPEAAGEVEDDGGDPLSMDHHTTSLRYIARLNGDVHENVLDAWDEGDNRWHHR